MCSLSEFWRSLALKPWSCSPVNFLPHQIVGYQSIFVSYVRDCVFFALASLNPGPASISIYEVLALATRWCSASFLCPWDISLYQNN
ncbi:hypothetical protein SLE2022_300020 [Rubroshorea leprosula]